eukprot:CAMPEP_0201643424 /NCGR_PEP_ID=MMETSP0493-20130528/28163_1 /ASSEMBLY_ACC=CAM_ASM_000838 /TAXON_ID=420259 /ORGANISM="Thalassiosira gravida, Strain GMp14c1" /LENGTH=219 /DNA_ID=CAMNT_0048117839 /DNA_START=113 /DNA_END=772 /DNA_ORIENTATION=+
MAMMHHILHFQRQATCAAITATTTTPIPRVVLHRSSPLHHRSISTTLPTSQAMPTPATSSEDPKTAQKKVMKEKKGPSKSNEASKEAAKNRISSLIVKALDAPWGKAPTASEEEMERRYNVGREYVIGSFKQHNEFNHDFAVKIRMKRHAMAMLPKEGDVGDSKLEDGGKSVYGMYREEAYKINGDMWGPPKHRLIPMHTPPIEGFDPSVYMDQENEDN